MATVTSKTSIKIDDLINNTVTSGYVNSSGHLILTTYGGSELDTGVVRTPILDAWPIGSIYSTVEDVDPSDILGGGTWIRWGQGQVPVGVDEGQTEFATVEQTGGEKEHQLIDDEMPSHLHSLPAHTHSTPNHSHGIPNHTHDMRLEYRSTGAGTGSQVQLTDLQNATGTSNTAVTISTNSDGPGSTSSGGAGTTGSGGSGNSGSIGGDLPHNILQPYITCYLWKRTA